MKLVSARWPRAKAIALTLITMGLPANYFLRCYTQLTVAPGAIKPDKAGDPSGSPWP